MRQSVRAANIGAIILLIFAVFFMVMGLFDDEKTALVLYNGDTGKQFAEFPVSEGERFSVGFLHSVNQSSVTDVYEIQGDQIFAVETIYYGFGAGTQSELREGEELTYRQDGGMKVTGINKEINKLSYIVGTVSDHVLTVNGREYSLRELCGQNSTVEIAVY